MKEKVFPSCGAPQGPTQGDEKRLGPATTLYGTVALSFVIPSEAEGSAVSLHPKPMVTKQTQL